MSADLFPKRDSEVLEAVKWAAGEEIPLEIIGQGSKQALGRPMQTAHTLDLSGLTGVTLFEPEELVLSAKAGTPLAEIEKLLDEHNQEFQFEAVDLGPLLGQPEGRGTLGGLVSTNICGPRRLKAGSVRDHILGVKGVSGRGEAFKSGGRVVKNVTGYDLSKGVTGSYGTLAVLTDIIMKVLPKAETEQTLVVHGLDMAGATEWMAKAMGSDTEVSSAAHLPAFGKKKARTIFRIEGFEPSVAYRMNSLSKVLGKERKRERLAAEESRALWKYVRDCQRFTQDIEKPVWRISCTPSEGWKIVSSIRDTAAADAYFDWQGGLIWLQLDGPDPMAQVVRNAVGANGGGHATLIRANPATRLEVDVFQPQAAPLAALSKRYKENFDPNGILNPGRMLGA